MTGAPRRGAEKYRSVEGRAGQSFGACIANVAILQRCAYPHASFLALSIERRQCLWMFSIITTIRRPATFAPPVPVLPSRSVLVTPAMYE